MAIVSRLDICARLSRIATRIKSLRGVDVFRINDVVKTVKNWQPATVLKYYMSGKFGQCTLAPRTGDEPHRKGAIHGNAMTLVGRSGAACEDQSSISTCRLGYAVGLMSSSLCVPCHTMNWTSKFTRTLVKSGPGCEMFAFSEISGHMSVLREYYGQFTDVYPGMAGLEDRESLPAHNKRGKLLAENFLARHFLAIQQAIEIQELDNVYWIPGRENPAAGLTKLRSEMLPLLRLMESGSYYPWYLRLLEGRPFGGINSAQPMPPAPKCLGALCMLLLVGSEDTQQIFWKWHLPRRLAWRE